MHGNSPRKVQSYQKNSNHCSDVKNTFIPSQWLGTALREVDIFTFLGGREHRRKFPRKVTQSEKLIAVLVFVFGQVIACLEIFESRIVHNPFAKFLIILIRIILTSQGVLRVLLDMVLAFDDFSLCQGFDELFLEVRLVSPTQVCAYAYIPVANN